MMFTPAELFDLSQTEHAAVFDAEAPAWEALPRLAEYLATELQPANHASVSPHAVIGNNVFLGKAPWWSPARTSRARRSWGETVKSGTARMCAPM